ncbi:MAG TPA: PKD domain-containing protein [Flavipsychrobacter sp.]|nr:PKD domain-containing protein [Flavipsychrobacter sp.]
MKIFLRSAILILLSFYANKSSGQLPVADFTATPITGCAPLIVQFTSTSTGNPTSYQWNLGNGVNTVQQNPSTAYTIPGTYPVTLTVTNSNGSNTKTVTSYITVIPNPTVAFSALDSSDCPPFSAQFSNLTNLNAPGAGTYSWSFGDGNVSSATNPPNTYTTPGQYTVTLVATNSAGCASSVALPSFITVYTPPVANFTGTPTSYCGTPATISFSANSIGTGPYTYNWDFGDGGTGVGANPAHVYTNSGIFSVTVIATDVNGCKDTVVKPNYISVGSIVAGFNTTPTPGCVNAPIQFNNTSNGGTSYYWNFGDGNTSTAASPTHTYTTAGVYTVKLAIYDGPCGDSMTQQITVNPAPNVNFSFSPNQPCPAPTLIQFNNFTSGASSFAWNFGDGGTSSQTSPSHTYTSNNFFLVSLTATNNFGCSSTAYDTVKVYSLDVYITPATPLGCVPLSVNFGHIIYWVQPITGTWMIYPYSVTNYSWLFGDGGSSTVSNPSHTYTNPNNNFTASLTITTSNGCTAAGIRNVGVGSKPTASFIDYPDTVCVKTDIHFINTTTDTTNPTVYTWYMGDTKTQFTRHAKYAYQNSGYYDVALVADNYGCKDTFKVDTAAVVMAPTARWIESYSCDTPLSVKFYDTLSVEPTSHIWYFGDGTSDTSTNPTHVYPALGQYNVMLVTFNSNYGCSDTLIKSIELVNPVLSFSTPDTAICRGDSILFTPVYSHTPSVYRWYINGVAPTWPFSPFSNPNPSTAAWGHRFNTKGIFDISVSTTDIHGCKDSVGRNDYVLVAKPQTLFSASPTIGCVPLTVLFKDTSTNVPGAFSVSRNWSFGNGTAITPSDTITRLYPIAGMYNVQLIVTDNVGCKDTLMKPAYVEVRKPLAGFVVDDSAACIGQVLTFTNNSTGVTFSSFWDFGDGTTSTGVSPTKTYTTPGIYTVKLIITDASGCQDSLIKLSYISITKPTAAFTMSDTQAVCPPLTVVFSNLSANGINYTWDFGNAGGSSLQNPSTIYSNPNLYQISLVVTDAQGCTDTAYDQVNVLGYAGGLSYTPLYGCVPLEVTFTSNIFGVPTMIWDFNDGVTMPVGTNTSVKHTYITPGAYLPKLILSDNAGCINSSNGIDVIEVDDVIAGFVTTPACVNAPVTFTDTSFVYFRPVTNWYWNFNGQQTSTTKTPSYSFTSPGTYTVTLGATNTHGCTDSVTKTIEVFTPPVVSAEFDTTICSGDPTQLSATGAQTYVWTPASSLSCNNCQSPVATPNVTTKYIVAGTDINGCVNKDSVLITVRYFTTSEVAPGGAICEDSSFQLLAFGAERYEWTPAETLNEDDIPNPIASPTTTTTYMVRAWEASCLADTNYVKVTVYPKPDVDAGPDDTTFAGKEIVLMASSNSFVSFLWSPGNTLNCTACSAPIAIPRATTNYKVIATSEKGCRNTDSMTVFIFCYSDQVFVPNTFTPNNDGQNDIFYPRGVGMKQITSFRIYNRWGEVVFERRGFLLNDASAGWDGTYKGQQLNSDIFIYSIDGICDSGEPMSWKGDVTLIR